MKIGPFWDDRLGVPRLKAYYTLITIPLFAIGTLLLLMHNPFWSEFTNASVAASGAYVLNLLVVAGGRRGSKWFSMKFRRAIRSATEEDNKELDRRIADLSRDLSTKLSLTPEQSELLLTALNNALEKVKHE